MSEKYDIETSQGKVIIRVTKDGRIGVFLPGGKHWRLVWFFNAAEQARDPKVGSNASFQAA